jgi:redox-sensitive bicupin YhaK (pirin superfamily)
MTDSTSDNHASPADASSTLRLRRSDERGYEDFGWADNWMTFSFADYHDPDWMHFGPLRVMVENHIQPHEGFSAHPHRDVEIVTYVASGVLTHGDDQGHEGEIGAGEMQLISAGRGMVHSEENQHDTVEHNYQMWLVPDRPGTEFAYHERGFSAEERQGRFRRYVAPHTDDAAGPGGPMPINTDASIYAGLFAPGDTATHPLAAGRGAWVQVVEGEIDVAGVTLQTGDGVGITDADALTVEAAADSEVLLFDVRMDVNRLWT